MSLNEPRRSRWTNRRWQTNEGPRRWTCEEWQAAREVHQKIRSKKKKLKSPPSTINHRHKPPPLATAINRRHQPSAAAVTFHMQKFKWRNHNHTKLKLEKIKRLWGNEDHTKRKGKAGFEIWDLRNFQIFEKTKLVGNSSREGTSKFSDLRSRNDEGQNFEQNSSKIHREKIWPQHSGPLRPLRSKRGWEWWERWEREVRVRLREREERVERLRRWEREERVERR